MEEIKSKINTQFKILERSERDSIKILERNKANEVEKHVSYIEKRLDVILNMKYEVQELMISEGVADEVVDEWMNITDEKMMRYHEVIDRMQSCLEDLQKKKEAETRKKEDEKQEERFRRRMEEELEIEKKKLEIQKKGYEMREEKIVREERSKIVKLPRLHITKFEGTHIDWFRFWNQYQAEIDRSELHPVSKFNYLKELLAPKVRLLIDALPFTSEGYLRAIAILKAKFGKPSEVSAAHIQCITSLPIIPNSNTNRIHEFYEKLVISVQALETMNKLKEINGYMRLTLDKLPGIRADLVRLDDNWQEWDFEKLVDSLRRWTERNPKNILNNDPKYKRENVFHSKEQKQTPRACVYCDKQGHKASECEIVKSVADRKLILSKKKLCFNCTGTKHRASDCRSNKLCLNCNSKHHTSICDKCDNVLLTTNSNACAYPVVIINIEGIKCRALVDTGSGANYVSSTIINLINRKINKKPIKSVPKQIVTLISSSMKNIPVYSVEIKDINNEFSFKTEINKLEKSVLLEMPNPNYRELQNTYPHLRDITLNDYNSKSQLPIHVVLGVNEYTKIKTPERARIGLPGEPIAELTKLGWYIISPGKENDIANILFSQTSIHDYEKLCSLDCLGVSEKQDKPDDYVYEKFREQLGRGPGGYYETSLIWKENHPPLRNNEKSSLGRLNNLIRNLNRSKNLEAYDKIMQEQIAGGIVEKVTESGKCEETQNSEKIFYMPHRAVIRESAESTKLRIVYDASAKANNSTVSLNDCLETGPPLQNSLYDILVRSRMRPILLCGDIQKAFWQIRIREFERNALRFHWIKNLDPNIVEINRFCRLLFGLTQSPFILEGTIKQHFENYENEYPIVIENIQDDMYVDDLVSGGTEINTVKNIKQGSIELFSKGGFNLHKWHSNIPSLENNNVNSEQTYAKELFNNDSGHTKY